MMHSEKADEDGGVQATVKRTRLASVGGFSQSARVITSSIPPHERTRRRSRTAAVSLLGSPWHLVVGSRKKIIARRSSLKWCPPRFKAIRHYRAEFYESVLCNSACRGRWEDADLTNRYTRLYRVSVVTRFASRREPISIKSRDYDTAKGQRSKPKSPEPTTRATSHDGIPCASPSGPFRNHQRAFVTTRYVTALPVTVIGVRGPSATAYDPPLSS